MILQLFGILIPPAAVIMTAFLTNAQGIKRMRMENEARIKQREKDDWCQQKERLFKALHKTKTLLTPYFEGIIGKMEKPHVAVADLRKIYIELNELGAEINFLVLTQFKELSTKNEALGTQINGLIKIMSELEHLNVMSLSVSELLETRYNDVITVITELEKDVIDQEQNTALCLFE